LGIGPDCKGKEPSHSYSTEYYQEKIAIFIKEKSIENQLENQWKINGKLNEKIK